MSVSTAHLPLPASPAQRLRNLVSRLGIPAAVNYLFRKRVALGRPAQYTLHPRRALHPLTVRAESSDIEVFHQIFIEEEYGGLDGLRGVDLVIDGGANVGYSAAYFLSIFPDCHVVAVEPEPGNYAILQKNVQPYGARVETIQAGIWPHSARLAMVESAFRDGREWSRQVRECKSGEPSEMNAVGIGEILAASGRSRISLLKLDVEGAEAMIFSANCESWIDRVDTIVIELHDDSMFGNGTDVFFAAIEGRGFDVSRSGELTIARARR